MAETFESSDERNETAGDSDIHAQAIRRSNDSWMAERLNIQDGREDQRFYAGEQWPQQDAVDRDRERRPRIVINRLPQFVRQVTGDIRKDPPATKVIPAKDATKQAAELRSGLIRNIEVQSNAKVAYVQAVDNACQVGMGVWRIVTEYENDNAFEQVIRIKRVQDPFAALCDASAREPDKSDARFWLIIDEYAEEEFKRQFPGKSVDGFPTPPDGGFIWRTENSVRVAEYWYKEPATKTIQQLSDGSVVEKDPKTPIPPGLTVLNTREVKTWQVKQVLMSGKELLTEPQDWAGRYIPIVPVIGEEIRFDGRTIRRGMVRDARGPQQVYNYMRTASVEYVSKQPSAPFVGTVKQFAGHEDKWADAGSGNAAYLPYNPDTQAPGRPEREQPPQSAGGLDQQAVIAANDIEAVIGIYKPSLGAQSNETSGRAILARQKEADTGTFFFTDNLRDGLMYSGKIILDLIPHIYDTARIIRIIKDDGTNEMVPANQPMPPGVDPAMLEKDEALQLSHSLNDLSVGEYDVVITTGPGYATKRLESQEMVMELMRSVPAVANVAPDVLVRNMDFPGSDEIAARIEAQSKQPPNPALVAEAREHAAKADLAEAQAEGQTLENLATGVQLMGAIDSLKQAMVAMQGQLAQMAGAPQPQAAPQNSPQPPGAPTPPQPSQPPGQGGQGEPGELIDMPASA